MSGLTMVLERRRSFNGRHNEQPGAVRGPVEDQVGTMGRAVSAGEMVAGSRAPSSVDAAGPVVFAGDSTAAAAAAAAVDVDAE
ncbi:unnamed protein product, partial [Closterium sp. Naga37s-1]